MKINRKDEDLRGRGPEPGGPSSPQRDPVPAAGDPKATGKNGRRPENPVTVRPGCGVGVRAVGERLGGGAAGGEGRDAGRRRGNAGGRGTGAGGGGDERPGRGTDAAAGRRGPRAGPRSKGQRRREGRSSRRASLTVVLVEAGVEQPVAVRVAGQEVHGAAGSTAPQRRMPLGEAGRRGPSGQLRGRRGRKRKAHRLRAQPESRGAPSTSTRGLPGGEGAPRASRLWGAGPARRGLVWSVRERGLV